MKGLYLKRIRQFGGALARVAEGTPPRRRGWLQPAAATLFAVEHDLLTQTA